MKIHRLYADEHGETHFEDVEITFTETTRAGRLSARQPATGMRRISQPPSASRWRASISSAAGSTTCSKEWL